MEKVTLLPDQLPKVHQCGCGSQAFHLCEDGRVVCLQCRYVIEPLSVVDSRVAEPASLGAEAAARDYVEQFICTSRAENYAEEVSRLEAIIHKHQGVASQREGWQWVPKEPTETQWSGLTRAIVMWMDMSNGPKLPRDLLNHLERSGQDIPQWLRDEPEMQNLDHSMGKGSRAVLIYKAMLAAAPATQEDEPRGEKS